MFTYFSIILANQTGWSKGSVLGSRASRMRAFWGMEKGGLLRPVLLHCSSVGIIFSKSQLCGIYLKHSIVADENIYFVTKQELNINSLVCTFEGYRRTHIKQTCEHAAFIFTVVQALLQRNTLNTSLYSVGSHVVLKNWVPHYIMCSFLHSDSFSCCLVVVTLFMSKIYIIFLIYVFNGICHCSFSSSFWHIVCFAVALALKSVFSLW